MSTPGQTKFRDVVSCINRVFMRRKTPDTTNTGHDKGRRRACGRGGPSRAWCAAAISVRDSPALVITPALVIPRSNYKPCPASMRRAVQRRDVATRRAIHENIAADLFYTSVKLDSQATQSSDTGSWRVSRRDVAKCGLGSTSSL